MNLTAETRSVSVDVGVPPDQDDTDEQRGVGSLNQGGADEQRGVGSL